MSYNPAMYNNYGQYPQPVQQIQQQSYAPQSVKGTIEWVDGEVGAKAYQIPAGLTTPIALWDTNDTVIYVKSVSPLGIPNPLQRIRYQMEESVPKYMGRSETANLMSGEEKQTEYARKEDLDRVKEEIMETIREFNTAGKHAAKE